jgi:DUF1680 family protein
MIDSLDRYHGQVTGVFSGDECVSGKDPLQGTELCGVADYMFSLELAMAVLGDPDFGDRLERITFNAWPATMSPDMWSHQYDQQANQVICSINQEHQWSTNGPQSNIFGLEPNFGCCTANLHQAWPKFAAHLWMQTGDNGIAAVAYAPGITRFESSGVPVEIELTTDYPFRDTLAFTIKAAQPVSFPLQLRIPRWVDNPGLTVDGGKCESPVPGTFYTMEREWQGETTLVLKLPMHAASSRRYNNALAIERGPLVYSLKIDEEWRRVNTELPCRELPHADWEVHPASAWNYALQLDETNLEDSIVFTEKPMTNCPFSPERAPVEATCTGRKLPGWQLKNGWADETPLSPAHSDEPEEELTLLPYGCTNLRLTEFPVLHTK